MPLEDFDRLARSDLARALHQTNHKHAPRPASRPPGCQGPRPMASWTIALTWHSATRSSTEHGTVQASQTNNKHARFTSMRLPQSDMDAVVEPASCHDALVRSVPFLFIHPDAMWVHCNRIVTTTTDAPFLAILIRSSGRSRSPDPHG